MRTTIIARSISNRLRKARRDSLRRNVSEQVTSEAR
jgi:hypothetical protein